MKINSSLAYFLFLLLLISGCSQPEDRVPTTSATDSLEDLEGATVISQGELSGRNGYTALGDVQLIRSEDEETYSLVFEDFSSSNGPDLKIYLASGEALNSFISLGDLKSTNGTLRYDFPASQFQPEFNTAVVWCERFSQLFGLATLEAP